MEINVKRLLKDLSNPDDDLRTLSAMTLMKIELNDRQGREEVIQALMKSTQDKNISVRFFARKAIDKLKRTGRDDDEEEGELPPPPLDEGLQAEDFQVRLDAVMTIAREGKSEFKSRLVAMLKTEKHDFVRAGLVSCLKNFLETEEADLLSPFLADPDNRVRANAIEALEHLKAEDAIPLLFPSLQDSDNRIRASAAKALASFGEEKVFAVLRKMLNSDEEWMKVSAIYSLGHIQAGEAISLLIEAAKSAPQPETRVKALISLANYHDLTVFGFLQQVGKEDPEPFRGAAKQALKLIEEKFGADAPTSTMVEVPQTAEDKAAEQQGGGETPSTDLAGTVSRFFRQGKDEVVGMSQQSSIRFAVNDLEKERAEIEKETGRLVFEMYQQGLLELPELLTIGHEILRMNFFIEKHSEEEDGDSAGEAGFFAQLKNLFSKAQPKSGKASQAEKFIKRREDLFQRLGKTAFRKMEDGVFQAESLETYHAGYVRLGERLAKERQKLGT